MSKLDHDTLDFINIRNNILVVMLVKQHDILVFDILIAHNN
ncbi:Bicyclomycin resistance protein [Rickettsia prowazekii str. Breinl]|nr:hypothetical protein H374_3570 [Rickettsia prowazekii str. NMRC Madrid E]AGJ03059.1 Bicyclomycin resistance protein [Rickettsia prowazekii str. Breinl]